MKLLRRSLAAFAALCLASAVFAADPSGTWTFAGGFGRGGGGGGGGQGGTPPQSTVVLALKDGKLTGKFTAPGRGGQAGEPVEIKDGTFKDDTVSFSVTTPGRDGATITRKYTGKLAGDTITGTREGPGRDGGSQSLPWEAKRAK